MKPNLFHRSALALAITGTAAMPSLVWSESLLDGSSAVLTLREAPGSYEIDGFDMVSLPGGSFVVVWAENGSGSPGRVMLGLFNSSGQPIISARPLVQGNSSGDAFEFPAVAADQAGNLVVAWTVPQSGSANSTNCGGNATSDIDGLLFSPPYTSSSALPLYESMGSNPCGVDIAMDNDGDFVLVWHTDSSSANYDLSIQSYLSGGVPSRGRKALHSINYLAGIAQNNDQKVLIGWEDYDNYPTIDGSILDLHLNPILSSVDLDNGHVLSSDSSVSSVNVAPDRDGGFVSSWLEGSDDDIYFQRWNANGYPNGTPQLINNLIVTSSTYADNLSFASDSEGHLVAVWGIFGNENSVGSFAVDVANNTIAEGGVRITGSLSDTLKHGPEIAMNNDVIAIGWVPNDRKTIDARVLQPLASESSTNTDDSLLGSLNHFVMLVLAGLLGLYRRRLRH
ncbi:hypothetical protein BGP77_02010 [Saccharospirillum sp. MSK14-1]|uniref:hypothetical protein n=1 Tax=Saccharospirillum sp. MSK14-1 TaxID=1897632 RepID=UPI000D3B27A2|nr:hypothetical protein [Saccharospirillum sp. MSK14-1]PTY36115.1 hypothetical protein BGP77_02010 [Saccharospirillum sp. MSK14-1]